MERTKNKKFNIEVNNNGKCAVLECVTYNNCVHIPCYIAKIKQIQSNFAIREVENIPAYLTPIEELYYNDEYTVEIPDNMINDLQTWIISKMKEIFGQDSNVKVEEAL